MTLAKFVLIALQASVFLTVFSLGLNSTFGEAFSLWRRPKALIRSLVAMYVVMPVVALLLARTFNFDTSVEIAILVLAVSPVPPFLPLKGVKAGSSGAFMFGLMVESALVSVVVTPIAVVLLGRALGLSEHVSPLAITVVVMKTVLLPLGLGMLVRAMSSAIAQRIVRPVGIVSVGVLLLCALLLMVASREEIGDLLGNGTLVGIAIFSVVGLAVGHLLGGPAETDRTFLALATAARHPGVAFAVAHAVAPEQQKMVVGAILLYLVVFTFISAPYTRWRKRGFPAAPPQTLPHPS